MFLLQDYFIKIPKNCSIFTRPIQILGYMSWYFFRFNLLIKQLIAKICTSQVKNVLLALTV